MYVIVQLGTGNATDLLNKKRVAPGFMKLSEIEEEFGITFKPLHPGSTDPRLVPYLFAEVKDERTAKRLISRLGQLENISSAYLKPQDEPP